MWIEILRELRLNDIKITDIPIDINETKQLKQDWLDEWKKNITKGFPSFSQIENAELHWYTKKELIQKIVENEPRNIWFRLVLIETMLFEPYYPIETETDKKGNEVPSKKYTKLKFNIYAYSKSSGDKYIDSFFNGSYYQKSYIFRLRKTYDKVILEMKEVVKGLLIGGAIAAGIALATILTAGLFAPAIAVALVGSNFVGLSGAALTSACLAYLGGGAIAIGGAGMAGGTIAIVGGAAILGTSAGLGVGGAIGAVSILGKQNAILQSAKLLVSIREIFLNDEYDIDYSKSVYGQYVQTIIDIEKELVELRMEAEIANDEKKKELKRKIKNTDESVKVMKIAKDMMIKFISSFEEGLLHIDDE